MAYEIEFEFGGKKYVIETNKDTPPTEEEVKKIFLSALKDGFLKLEDEKPSKLTRFLAKIPAPEYTPEIEKTLQKEAVFASHFAPILKIGLSDEEKKALEELQKQYPASAIIGTITGSIAELSLMSPVGRMASLPVMRFLSKTPRLARFIGSGVRSGITFAGQGLLRESVEQATKKELNVRKLLESAGTNFLFGAGLGTTEQIMSIPVRTAISSAYAGSYTALEDYIKEKKIHPVDVLVNTAIVGGFTALTGKQVSEDIRKQIENNLREVVKKKIITANPDISPDIIDKATNSFLNAYFNEVYKRGGRFPTPKEIEDFTGAIAQGWKIYVENPIGIKANIDPEFNKRLTMAISPINYPTETKIVSTKSQQVKTEVKSPKPISVRGEVKPTEPIPVEGKVVKTPKKTEKPISIEISPEREKEIKDLSQWIKNNYTKYSDISDKLAKEIVLKDESKWSSQAKEVMSKIRKADREAVERMAKKQEEVPYEDWKITDQPEPLTSIPVIPEPNPEDVKKINDTRLATILASQIIKKFPGVSGRLKTKSGFYAPKTKDIVLNAEIFKNTPATLKTILHETGHAVDKILLSDSERANLLGRLNALQNFVGKTFQGVSEKEVREECMKVSEHFFGKERIEYYLQKKGYMPGEELYADLFTGILLDPITTRKLAPKASKMFWDGINKNNEIADMLRRTLEITTTEIDEAVNQILRLGFNKELTNEDLINLTRAKLYERNVDIESLVKEMVEKNRDELKKKEELFKEIIGGKGIEAKRKYIDKNAHLEKAMEWLLKNNKISKDDYYDLINTFTKYFVSPFSLGEIEIKKIDNIISQYANKGVSLDEISLVLFLKRVFTYDEVKTIAEPFGIRPEHIPSMLQRFKEIVGEEKFNLINEAAEKIKDWHNEVLKEAVRLGFLKQEDVDEWVKNYYVPQVIEEHIKEEITPFFKKRKGTLEPPKQPLINLIFKTSAIKEFAERNMYKRKIFDKVIKDIPGVQKINVPPPQTIIPPKGMVELKFVRDGKWERYLIPEELGTFMKSMFTEDLGKIDEATNVFKSFFTRYNPAFLLTSNPVKDFTETIVLAGNLVLSPKLPIYYARAYKKVRQFIKGEITKDIEDLVRAGILDETVWGFLDEEKISKTFDKYDKKLIEDLNNASFKEKVLLGLEKFKFKLEELGIMSEKIHKVAGYLAMKDRAKKLGLSDPEIEYYTLWFVGSPNFKAYMEAKKEMERIFFFYNPYIQGTRRYFMASKDPRLKKCFLPAVAVVAIIPAALKLLGERGFLGEEIQDKYLDISPSMKLYYPIVFPLGETPDGDLIMFRVPSSNEIAFLNGFFYLTMKSILDKMGIYTVEDLLRTQEQLTNLGLPNVNPALLLIVDLAKSAQGIRPVEYRSKSRMEFVVDRIGDSFNLREIKMIIKDIKEGKDVVINTSLRVPLLNRFLKIIPQDQRYKNRLRNLGIE